MLDQLVAAFAEDPHVAGLVLVGSGAVGFADPYSDIDLCVVVNEPDQARHAFDAWGGRFHEMLRVSEQLESVRGEDVFLWVMLLENFLELDVCFLPLTSLSARRERWKVLFDRTDRIAGIMQQSWDARTEPDVRRVYERIIASIWHYVIHGVVAVQRKQYWRALCELEEIRNQTIELLGLRHGIETKRFRDVDRLAPNALHELEGSIVAELTAERLMAAIRHTTHLFFQEAQWLDQDLGLNHAAKLERKMDEYLGIPGSYE